MQRRWSLHSGSPSALQPIPGIFVVPSPQALSPVKALASSAQGAKRISCHGSGSHRAPDQPQQ